MGKRRMINMDGLLFDAKIAGLGLDACLLYIRLWTLAEDWGGIEIDPQNIKLQMGGLQNDYPEERITEIIGKLTSMGKITVYESCGVRYGWLNNFFKHQKLLAPSPSNLPLPPWIRWFPKTDPKSPAQHYELDESLIHNLSTGESSDTPPINPRINPPYNRIEVNRREENIKNNPSHKVTSMPSISNGAHIKITGGSDKQILSQLGVGGIMKTLKGDRKGMEPTERQEKNINQDLERIRIENEKRGIKP